MRSIFKLGGNSSAALAARILGTQAAALAMGWKFDEAAGPTAFDFTGHKEDICVNGGFETPGGGGADVVAGWTESVTDGAIAQTTAAGEFHTTTGLKITAGPGRATNVLQAFTVKPGSVIPWTFWTRGDGTNAGRYRLRDATNSTDLIVITSTGVTSATWTQISTTFTVPAGCTTINIYHYCPNLNTAWACFDDNVFSVPVHTTYAASGITYGQPGARAGELCIALDGNNSYVNLFSVAINQALNLDKGSVVGRSRIDAAATWADTSTARWWFHPRSSDVDHYIAIGQEIDGNLIGFRRRAGGANPINSVTYACSETGWIPWGMTWDVAANELIAYLFGVEVGRDACAGAWDKPNNPIATGSSVLWAGSITLQEWKGWGGPMAVWANQVLTAGEMAYLGKV